jgi:NAD(P)-dependent dehydrogenase (short-subunit alcohol dehydrogenase family)
MKQLGDRIVLITGAGGGFGRELTEQFLRAGSCVILRICTPTHCHAPPKPFPKHAAACWVRSPPIFPPPKDVLP